MQRIRIIILAALVFAPVVSLIGYAVYDLWLRGYWFWAWWPLMGSLALAYFLAWRWQRKQRLLSVDFTPSLHWTERDRQAWNLVQARATEAAKLTPDQLSSINLYTQTAQDMANELVRFYHPTAKDPVGALTIPEILAVVELAAHDLAEMVDRYLPGGHLISVNDWRRARQAADWYQKASDVVWIVSAVFAPVTTGTRYLASQLGLKLPWQKLQENLLLWFYSAYVHRLGNYLIELNSGRLRVGARRYQELKRQMESTPHPTLSPGGTGQGEGVEAAGPSPDVAPPVSAVTIALAGQTGAGKSSLINALLGEQRAMTDVLPSTSEVTRYSLRPTGSGAHLEVLDTIGYGVDGAKPAEVAATQDAARQADVLLVVLHARNPARQADADLLKNLHEYFTKRPELNKPPILAVLTHIDLLSPMMEWSPPYDWQNPQRPKAQQIALAVEAARHQLGAELIGVVPVCTAAGKVYGIEQWLLPAIIELLGQARAVAFLRCLRNEADAGKIRKVFDQLLSAGKEAARIWWDAPTRP